MDNHYCNKCCTSKPVEEFYVYGTKVMKPCKECQSKKYKTPEYKEYRRRQQRRLKFGIAHDRLEAQLRAQGNACAICLQEITELTLVVDHNHQTRNVRGLLCAVCNSGIGHLRDDPQLLRKAIEYLEGGGVWITGEAFSNSF